MSSLPKDLIFQLDQDGGSIIAPVKLSPTQQQFQMCIVTSEGDVEIRKITDFGVIFEDAK